MGTLMAYGPDVVGLPGGPPHGLVELWKNSGLSSAFAGQTVTIENFDFTKYDAIIIAIETASGEYYGARWYEFDSDILSSGSWSGYFMDSLVNIGNGTILCWSREISIIRDVNDLKITFGDANYYPITTYGVQPTGAISNTELVPVRILGLIHND